MKTDKFTKLAIVDEGPDGVVYKREDSETNGIYAFKKLKLRRNKRAYRAPPPVRSRF